MKFYAKLLSLALGGAIVALSAQAMESKEYKKFSKNFRDDVDYEDFSQSDLDDMSDELDRDLQEVNSADELLGRKKRVRYNEIKSWQLVGDRFALGSGEEGDALAIYDLSWPQLFSFSHFPRTLLGSIGIGDLNVAKLVEVIRGVLNRKGDDNILASDKFSKVDKTLSALERDFGALKNEFPDQWWKKVQWKGSLIAQSDEAPAQFLASDMDLAAMSGRPEKFAKVEAKVNERLNEFLELNIKRSFFDHFQYVKREDGKGYDLYFILPERDYVTLDLALRPKKIADLRNPSKSFVRTFGVIAVEQALKQLVGLIPIPVVGDLLDIAIGRWFNLVEQQEEAHHSYALELYDQAMSGNARSPFAHFDEDVSSALGQYLVAQQAPWYKAIFKGSGSDDYDKYVEKRDEANQESHDWLVDHDYSVTDLSGWFAQAEKDGKKRLFLLNEQYRFSKHPLTGMNYQHPEWEIVWRHLVEAGDIAIDLIPIPVPFASTALGLVYSFFVQEIVEDAQTEEARFRAWVSIQAEGDWRAEAQHMVARRLNPFELAPEGEAELIARRRAHLGI